MKLFLAYHEAGVLRECAAPPNTQRLLLPALPLAPTLNQNAYAESRALLYLHDNISTCFDVGETYFGLFHASYPTKFSALPPLTDLPAYVGPVCAPERVFAPVVVNNYLDQADACHAGMKGVLENLFRTNALRPAPACNTFIAHRDVWMSFLPAWKSLFDAARDAADAAAFDRTNCKPGVEPAYLLERLTLSWFANQNLQVHTITNAEGVGYYPMNDSGPMLHPPGFGWWRDKVIFA